MNYRVALCLIAALFVVMPVAAQSSEFGVVLAQSRVGETDAEEVVLEFDNGDGFGISFNHYFSDTLSLEFSATMLSHDGNVTDGTNTFDPGTLDVIPIVGTVQFHFARRSMLSPYIGGGLAYIMADDLQSADLDDVGIGDVEVESAVTWAVQAGLDINLSERFAIAVDGKYTGYTPNSAPSGIDFEETELDLNPLIISAGVKLRW